MTKLSQHTPGPWVFWTQPYQFRTGEGIAHSIQAEDGTVIVLLAPPGFVTDKFKANAHLIAAAPDMLAELQRLHAKHGEQATGDLIARIHGEEPSR